MHPFVGFVNETPDFKNDEREVEELLETPLELLLDDSIVAETKINLGNGVRIKTPYFDLHERVVWGATAMILNEFKELVTQSRRETSSVVEQTFCSALWAASTTCSRTTNCGSSETSTW